MSWTAKADDRLIEAAMNGRHQDLVNALSNGANPNVVDEGGLVSISALQHAVASGSRTCVEELIDAGANINWYTFEEQRTALHVAVLTGELQIMDYLLDAGANIEQRDIDGATPFLCSFSRKKPNEVSENVCAKRLVDRGANVFACMYNGVSALHLAAWAGDTEIIDILLSMGLDLSAHCKVNVEDESVFAWALRGEHEKSVMTLLKRGLDWSQEPEFKDMTLLEYAKNKDWIAVVAWLEKEALRESMGANRGEQDDETQCSRGVPRNDGLGI